MLVKYIIVVAQKNYFSSILFSVTGLIEGLEIIPLWSNPLHKFLASSPGIVEKENQMLLG